MFNLIKQQRTRKKQITILELFDQHMMHRNLTNKQLLKHYKLHNLTLFNEKDRSNIKSYDDTELDAFHSFVTDFQSMLASLFAYMNITEQYQLICGYIHYCPEQTKATDELFYNKSCNIDIYKAPFLRSVMSYYISAPEQLTNDSFNLIFGEYFGFQYIIQKSTANVDLSELFLKVVMNQTETAIIKTIMFHLEMVFSNEQKVSLIKQWIKKGIIFEFISYNQKINNKNISGQKRHSSEVAFYQTNIKRRKLNESEEKKANAISSSDNCGFASFQYVCTIGEGNDGYIHVWRFNSQKDGTQHLAVKSSKGDSNFTHEVSVLKGLRHQNIVQCNADFKYNERHFIIFPLLNCDLLKVLCETDVFANDLTIKSNNNVKKIFINNIASALQYMHKKGVIHRDVKLENILCRLTPINSNSNNNMEYVIKFLIGDFGIAQKIGADACYGGTPPYFRMDEQKDMTAARDLFALGVVVWELVFGRSIYNSTCVWDGVISLASIREWHCAMYRLSSPIMINNVQCIEMEELVKGLLDPSKLDRWTGQELIDFPYIKSYNPNTPITMEYHSSKFKSIPSKMNEIKYYDETALTHQIRL